MTWERRVVGRICSSVKPGSRVVVLPGWNGRGADASAWVRAVEEVVDAPRVTYHVTDARDAALLVCESRRADAIADLPAGAIAIVYGSSRDALLGLGARRPRGRWRSMFAPLAVVLGGGNDAVLWYVRGLAPVGREPRLVTLRADP